MYVSMYIYILVRRVWTFSQIFGVYMTKNIAGNIENRRMQIW